MGKFSNRDMGELLIEIAVRDDVAALKPVVEAAYSKYIQRLGKLPAPMTVNYHELVDTRNVHVLRVAGNLLGSIVLYPDGDTEEMARSLGLTSISLYTNVKTHENIALYTKIGFMATDRKVEAGFERVHFRKNLDGLN